MAISVSDIKRAGALFLAAFGVLSLVITTASLFVPESIPHGWPSLAIMVGISGAIMIGILCWPKRSVHSDLRTSDSSIEVRIGDLFAETGHIVIGTNDCFDTELGDIINPGSVQGQFLQRYYKSDPSRLDTEIQIALNECGATSIEDHEKHLGKPFRYPIGTVIGLRHGSSYCFMSAYARMGNDLKCDSSPDRIWNSLSELWKAVRGKGECGAVSMPVIGSEFARSGLSRHRLIQLIILSFVVASKAGRVSRKLYIAVRKGDLKHIDFRLLEQFMNSVCA